MLGATQQRWRSVSAISQQPAFANPSEQTEKVDLPSLIALPHSDRIHQFLGYWKSLRGDKRLPKRADLDPLAIASVLTGIWLITVDSEDGSFSTRLAGESTNRFFGRAMAGQSISSALPETAMATLLGQLESVRDRGCLLLEQGDLLRPDGSVVCGERLFAPFSTVEDDSGPVIDHIVGVTIASGAVSKVALGITPPSKIYEASPL